MRLVPILPRAARQCRGSHRYRFLIVSLSMGLALAACHTRPILQEPAVAAPNPMDRIAVQVMAVGAFGVVPKCDYLRTRRVQSSWMLDIDLGDTTFYYYQDSSRSHPGRRPPVADMARDRRRHRHSTPSEVESRLWGDRRLSVSDIEPFRPGNPATAVASLFLHRAID